MEHLHVDRGAIVLGWLTRVVMALAVLGVLGFDAASLGSGQLYAEDHAQRAARAAVENYGLTTDLQLAYDAALDAVLADGDTIDVEGFAAGPGGSITLRLRREVPTLVVEKIPPLRGWATITSTVTARPTP